MIIEQAIFASSQTAVGAGYQLVAASPGIVDTDARELSAWGPSHDSLWESGPAAASVNFHRLPSGAYCVSQTSPAGAEYSQRRGPNVYTQSLVVSPEGLAQFGNNPFALLQAAIALGEVCVHEKIPKRLDPFLLEAEARWVDKNWLAQLIRHPGPVWLGAMLQTALTTPAVGIVGGDRGASLVAALMHCLPVECRPEFSFSTGLRFSPRRPFRVICLPNHPADNRRLQRQEMLTLLEMKSPPPEPKDLGGWASFVAAMITSGNTEYLAAVLSERREGLEMHQLDALGTKLIQGMGGWRAAQAHVEKTPTAAELPNAASAARPASPAGNEPASALAGAALDAWQRADGSHRRGPLIAATLAAEAAEQAAGQAADFAPAAMEIEEEPAVQIGRQCPAAADELQALEDAIFDALAGKPQALVELKQLWPTVLKMVGRSMTEPTREHYLRYALALWRQFNTSADTHDPARACQAMEVICLLFGQ